MRVGALKRWLRGPLAGLVLVALLLVSVGMLPKGWYDGSVVGAAIGRLGQARPTRYRAPLVEVFIIKEDGRLVIHDPGAESFDAIARAITETPEGVLRVTAERVDDRSGVYALTRRTEVRYVLVLPMGTPARVSGEEMEHARAMFIDWLATANGGEWTWFADEVRGGDRRWGEILWAGVAHDAATVVIVMGLVYSLRWNLSPGVWRERRRARRVARGECPGCRYPMAGLMEERCPECGEGWGEGQLPKGK